MLTFKKNLPVILMLLLEILVGILLLINPEAFTTAVYIAFGIFCIVVGAIYLIKFLRRSKEGEGSALTLVWAAFLLVLGLFAVASFSLMLTIPAFIAVMYAIIMVVSGVFKVINFLNARRLSEPVSWVGLAGAVVSIVIGGVIAVNPFDPEYILFVFTGVCILVTAAIDLASLILTLRMNAHPIDDGSAEAEVLDTEQY